MNAFTDNGPMLADSVRRWAGRSGQAAADPALRWAEFAELGWLAVALPEVDGGLGGSLADVCIVAEELGRALVHEPYVASVALGGLLLADVAEGGLREAWLPALSSGTRRVVFAPWEPDSGHDPRIVDTVAIREGSGWRLNGRKSAAPGACGADALLVLARTGDETLGLFLLQAGDPGLVLDAQPFYDGRKAAALTLRNAPATLLWEAAEADLHALVGRAMDRAIVAHCAETAGVAAVAFETTRDYVAARRQFGRAIADNQVVQHRLVDLFVGIEEVRALWREASTQPSPRIVAALAARTAEVARHAWEEAIQLHGAIGMTEEYVLGGYVRRLALAASLYGDVHAHLERLAALTLGEDA